MPSTRRGKMKSFLRRTRHSPALETEPQDLRVVRRQPVMEQNAETNGCDNGPVPLAVSNHTESPQGSKADRQNAKSLMSSDSKTTRHISGGPKGARSRRNVPAISSHSIPTSPASERRATRHLPSSPVQATSPLSTSSDRRSLKNSHPSPAAHVQSNKKSSHPPTLSPQIANLTSVNASQLSNETTTVTISTAANSKHAKHTQHSHTLSPPLLTSQKRSSRNTSFVEGDPMSPRASKRVRLQHQPFQSPPPPSIIPAILRQNVIKTPEDKIVVFQKGEFLAVRNENGSFFVCRTAQNVYKSSKRFKIQWMSDKEPDIYIPDFYDQTDFECVLTNLRLKRVDKNKYMLPSEERQRTLNILQRALNVENGMDISHLQVTTDGVDVSIIGKEEEDVLKKQQESLKSEHITKKSNITHLRNRGRPRKVVPLQARKVTRSTLAAQKKIKTLAARVKLRSRETVKVKLKKEGGQIIVSNRTRKTIPNVRKIIERLHPNPKVTHYDKDPTFELNIPIPYVSSSAHSKLLIRAILLKDINMLQSLIKDTQKICSLNAYRSVDVQLTPLMYAVLEEDHWAIRALLNLNKKKYANPPETLLEYQGTGNYNIAMLGHSIRPINICRGGREGNNAFLKDISHCNDTYPEVDKAVIKEALRAGVAIDTLNLLYNENNMDNSSLSWHKDEVLQQIVVAVRNGHTKLAGQLIEKAAACGGYGFGVLHKEVLTKDRQPLSTFKPVSVTKKAIGNAKITPLHCSAINPNPQYLASLLAVAPEYNLPDDNGWRPIHYASVCKSTSPLELLISRGVSLEEIDSEGNTPLHVASISGRAHNVDLILRHLLVSDNIKKELNNGTAVTEAKFGAGSIDRGNKKSYTALHLACQYGHLDVVRVLLRYKPIVDKLTNASQDKLTPLMLASQRGHLNIVKLLVEHTARVELKDKKQRTALIHAVINGHANVTSYLLRLGANPNSSDSSGNTLVHYAAAYGWYFCLKLLIEAGSSLNLPNDWKITPLSLAFMKGHMGLVDFLVEQPGIDINVDVNNESGMTLVMQALSSRINHSMLERIHFLIVKQKSDCTKVDFMGNNALHHLVLSEVKEMAVEIKMEAFGGNRTLLIDDDDSISEDPMAIEIKEKHKEEQLFKEEAQQEHDALIQEITKLLLDHGCDPIVKNNNNESAFNLAVKEGCILLVKMFLDAGCQLSLDVSMTGDNILHYLVTHACHRKVEPLLQAILNANCSDSELKPHELLCKMAKMYNQSGQTPLLQALSTLANSHDEERKNRLLNFAKVLVDELQADVAAPSKNSEGKETSYALHLAALCVGGEVTEALLSHKPPLNSLNENGQSPLVLAILKENVEAVEALVKAGALVNLKSKGDSNLSPLLLASKNYRLGKIVQLLVQSKADVNEVDPINKNAALHYVVGLRAPDVLETAKALLTAGANVNAVNNRLRTPLHLAVNASGSDSDASYSVEECLLGFGAKLDAFDCRGRIPLHYAFVKIGKHEDRTQIDPIELVTLLTGSMGTLAVDISDKFGQTLLHLSAYRGATISTMHLAPRIKNLDVRDKHGNTALGLAVQNGHESCALMLLQRGASCVAELVLIPKEQEKPKYDIWEWKHNVKEPPKIMCHTILQEAMIKDWQGILYLMFDQLEGMGKTLSIAVEAALRTAKYNVALKLIGRVKHSWTLYNEKQSMLHVLAREAPASYLPNLQVKVAQFLIEKGVPTMARDEHGCSVLTYAAVNWNATLCNFFSSKIGISCASKTDPDKSLRTPLSALFWKLAEEDLPEDMRNFFLSLMSAEATLNVLTRYPIVISPFAGVRCSSLSILHIKDASAPTFSPLMVAIYKKNYAVVKLILSQSADINFPDEQLLTPLMHAVRLNDIKLVKLLLNYSYDPTKDKNPYNNDTEQGSFQKTSDVKLSSQDINGWTVVHHLVSPLPDCCYDNTALLYLLAEVGAPLDQVNKADETPLQMAMRLRREPMVAALQELLNIPEDKRAKIEPYNIPTISDGIQWEQSMWDYKADSESMLSQANATKMETDESTSSFKPDPLSGFQSTGDVVLDLEKNIPCDVVMTVVDLNYGAYGIYNFYKMQLIKQTGKELFILFTCWGRVGDIGQYQKTPFANMQEGMKEFCRIFKNKSGNNWEDIQNFQPQPKKYRLVQLDKRKFVQQNKITLDLKTDIPSIMSKHLQNLFENLMNVHTLNGALCDLGLDASFDTLPFGSLSEKTLMCAQDILKNIGNLISEKDNLRSNLKSQEKFAEIMHKIVKLSEEFYHLVPVYGYQYERLRPLFCAVDVHEKLVLIHNLLHIGVAGKLLLAANFRKAEINPKDYVYRSLGCQLELLEKESHEVQMILQYIHNTATYSKPHVTAIYRVHRPGEQETLIKSALPRHMLLWHGTGTSNLLSILSRGLQVAPLGAQLSGDLFGKGIYFADMFTKSRKYCVSHNVSGEEFILLCEVALGDLKEIDCSLVVDPAEECDSVKALGHKQPNPAECISWQGVSVPLGRPIDTLKEGSSTQHRFLSFNEYVVYKPSQVCIRYVVQFCEQSNSHVCR